MTITIKLKTDNAAFEDDREAEIMRILSEMILSFQRMGVESRSLSDCNGNRVGSVTVTGR